MRKLATVLLVLFSLGCCSAVQEKAEASSASITSYAGLEAAFPPTVHSPAVIVHDNTYTNYAPVGWVVDPTDNTKFILYINIFKADTDDDSKLVAYSGNRSDPFTLTLIGDVLTRGGGGSWDARGIYNSGRQVLQEDNGAVTILYGARGSGSDYYRIGRATSSDGRTFEKYVGNPVLSPGASYQGAGAGYQSGIHFKYGGTYYFLVTLVNNSIRTEGQALTYSADGLSWTDNGTVILPMGGPGAYDYWILETGQATVLGGDIAILYTALGSSDGEWGISLAQTADPTVPVSKSSKNPIFTNPGGHVACPILADMGGGRWIMYFQQREASVGLWNVQAAEFLDSMFSGGSLFGGSMH